MKTPSVNEVVQIEHHGQIVEAIVSEVINNGKGPGAHWIIVQVPSTIEFKRLDQCAWIVEGGKIPASVHEVTNSGGGITKLRMLCYSGAKSIP